MAWGPIRFAAQVDGTATRAVVFPGETFPFPPNPTPPAFTSQVAKKPKPRGVADGNSARDADVAKELRMLRQRLDMTEQKLQTIQKQREADKRKAWHAAQKKAKQAEQDAEDLKEKQEQEDEDADTLAQKLSDEWEAFQDEQKEKKEAAKKKPTFNIGGRIHWDTTWFPETTEGIDRFENPADRHRSGRPALLPPHSSRDAGRCAGGHAVADSDRLQHAGHPGIQRRLHRLSQPAGQPHGCWWANQKRPLGPSTT